MLLNIAIPTYKRPDQLRDCIKSIALQILNNENVSLTVIDDSKSDLNSEVVSWAESLPIKFTYIKNDVNLGIDGNIEKCLNFGSSEYLLVLGEDDILLPDAISRLIREIDLHRPDVIYTSYVYINNAKTKVIRSPLTISGKIFPHHFIENYLWAIGFIGSVVLKRSFINRNPNRYLGSYFNHVGRVGVNLADDTNIFAMENPLVGNRSDDLKTATWTSSYYDVLFGFEGLIQQLFVDSDFSLSFLAAKKTLRSQFNYLKFHRICLMRSYGIYDSRVYNKNISISNDIPSKRMYYVISILPRCLFGPLRVLYFFARYIRRLSYSVPDVNLVVQGQRLSALSGDTYLDRSV